MFPKAKVMDKFSVRESAMEEIKKLSIRKTEVL